MNILTANGPKEIEPIHCEVTGRQIGWMTTQSDEAIRNGCTPAYLSFRAVDSNGKAKFKPREVITF
jgi:hypothetical protein